jgi:hypothetical protein
MAHKKTNVFDDMPHVSRQEAREAGLKRYFTGAPCREGHVSPRYTKSNGCVICSAAAALAWQKMMYCERADELRQRHRDKKLRHPVAYMFRGVRSRAAKRGIQFTLAMSDVVIPDTCPCCATKMEMRSGPAVNGPLPNSPSLDRLDATQGYVPGNVAVICWRCNNLKRDATADELRTILTWMESLETKPARLKLVS